MRTVVHRVIDDNIKFSVILLDFTVYRFLNPRCLVSTLLLFLLAGFAYISLNTLSDCRCPRRVEELVAASFVDDCFFHLASAHVSRSISRYAFHWGNVLSRPPAGHRHKVWRGDNASKIIVVEVSILELSVDRFVYLDQYMVIKLIRRIIPISLIWIYRLNLIFKHEDFTIFERRSRLDISILIFYHPIWEEWCSAWKRFGCS